MSKPYTQEPVKNIHTVYHMVGDSNVFLRQLRESMVHESYLNTAKRCQLKEPELKVTVTLVDGNNVNTLSHDLVYTYCISYTRTIASMLIVQDT